ncbi:MAG: DUF5672 family protein [Calothrix sp. MO_192.B10]|nr:DUF5672 family protein [Calothrix sp. MO_192.B10]
MEICDVNRFYGHANIIKQYCTYPENEPIPMAIQHGYNRFYKLKHDHFDESLFDYWVYTPRIKENAINSYDISPSSIHILGSPFLYLIDEISYSPLNFNESKGTIAFPAHSIPDNQIVGTYDYYAEQLKSLPSEFHPITVCLHYHDINLGHHHAFYQRGFAVITCGNYSPLQNNYLHNFIHFCKSHKFITSNSYSSACVYGMYLGLKFFVYGEEPEYNPQTKKEKSGLTPEEVEEYRSLKERFNINYLENIISSNHQQKFAAEELGEKYKHSREELYSYLMNIRSQRPYIDRIKPLFFQISQSLIEQQKAAPPMQPLQLKQISSLELLEEAIDYSQTIDWQVSLRDITLVNISSVDVERCLLALYLSSLKIDFEKIVFFTSEEIQPSLLNLFDNLTVIKIPQINSTIDYSYFIIKELHKYIDTSYCLITQNDGFVINPELWSKQFLEYDYIAAPWPKQVPLFDREKQLVELLDMSKNRVGNGGFSLRSKKMLEVCALLDFENIETSSKSEDLLICHYFYDWFREQGIKFAPLEVATKFSFEQPIEEDSDFSWKNTFGFHGKVHLLAIFSELHERFAKASNYDEQTIHKLEINLKLSKTNLIIFPDWSLNEEELGFQLMELIEGITTHVQSDQITLLIDINGTSEESVDLFLQAIAMNLMMEQEMDITEKINISLVQNLTKKQWKLLLPRLNARILLKNENQQVIMRPEIQKISHYSLEELINQKIIR